MISDLRLLNFLFMDWENAVTVFKGIALFEFKEMKMGLLTRTGFSVCFHIPRVLKKRRQKKKRQLGALICVNPRTLRGRSCRMWNIRQGCRGWQGICRKVFPGMLSAVSVAEKLEGGVFQKGSCHVVSVFLF